MSTDQERIDVTNGPELAKEAAELAVRRREEALLEEALEESFPASDPPASNHF